MDLLYINIGIVINISIAWWMVSRREQKSAVSETGLGEYNAQRQKEKEENKQKILAAPEKNGDITNDDVEKLIGVSHATAFRLLEELEQEGKIRQVGKTGRSVHYKLVE